MTKKIHERLLDINSISLSVILYGIVVGIELGAFVFKIFEALIPNHHVRVLFSLVIGALSSKALVDISNNLPKKIRLNVTLSISVLEFLIMTMILDVLKQDHWEDMVSLTLFSLFVPYMGFWLNHTFPRKAKKKIKQEKRNQKEIIKGVKETVKQLEERKKKTEENLKEIEGNHRENKERLLRLLKTTKKSIEHSCDDCGRIFSSYQGKNRHECKPDATAIKELRELKEFIKHLEIKLKND